MLVSIIKIKSRKNRTLLPALFRERLRESKDGEVDGKKFNALKDVVIEDGFPLNSSFMTVIITV